MALTQEQIDARRGKITSSILAACLGFDEYKTQRQAAIEIIDGSVSFSTKATERGDRLEDTVVSYPTDLYGWRAEKAPFRVHPKYPWAADSADAIYFDDNGTMLAVGDAKTVSGAAAGKYGREGTDEVPTSVLYQCHWHLIHWPEVERCVVPVLVGGSSFEFRCYFIDKDIGMEQLLLNEAERFYTTYIEPNELPPLSKGDKADLLENYNQKSDELVKNQTIEDIGHRLKLATLAKKEADARVGLLQSQMINAIGDKAGAAGDWGSAIIREARGAISYGKLVKDIGVPRETIEQYRGRDKKGLRVMLSKRKEEDE